MAIDKRKPWFAVKRYGYGVGLPVSWEGWLALGSFLLAVVLTMHHLPRAGIFVVLLVLAPSFVWLTYARSDEEWRWRWGEKD